MNTAWIITDGVAYWTPASYWCGDIFGAKFFRTKRLATECWRDRLESPTQFQVKEVQIKVK